MLVIEIEWYDKSKNGPELGIEYLDNVNTVTLPTTLRIRDSAVIGYWKDPIEDKDGKIDILLYTTVGSFVVDGTEENEQMIQYSLKIN